MAYYSDPANAPVACQEFADGFRQGMDYFVPQDDDHESYNKKVTTTAHSIGGPQFHKDAVVCESLVHVEIEKPGTFVHANGTRHCMIYFHGGGGVAGTPKQH